MMIVKATNLIFATIIGLLTSGCNTALDPTVNECNYSKDEIYCVDSKTHAQCMICRDPTASSDNFACWKFSTCAQNYQCRYFYDGPDEKSVGATCYDPDSPSYQGTYAENPEK